MKNKNLPFIIFAVVLVLVLVGVILFAMNKEPANSGNSSSTETESDSGYVEKWQEGVISYNGKYYKFNNDINTYLFLGIDKETITESTDDSSGGGQSDAMFLLVTNADDKTLSVISINRNSMVPIDMSNSGGVSLGSTTAQICTQYGFGDGKEISCRKTTEVVSYLFYKLPIDGYMSVTMSAMPIMNDAVGGVEVTVLEDIQNVEHGVDLKEGETVTLQGMEAYYYLRSRDRNEFDSATQRLRRQEQYITGLVAKLKEASASGKSKVLAIYDDIKEYMVTNIDFIDFIDEIESYEYDESRLYTVPGETRMGEKFEEYYVDDDALYDLIIQVFYEEVSVDK